jgi:two-component system sensor histidine kinase KdpD
MLTRDHYVDVAIEPGLPHIRVDQRSVVEVLYMLLDNASKYAPPGTQIGISARVGPTGFVTIFVSDRGPGIPPEFRERVFERFFRIPNRESHDRSRAGGGIGLALAKQLLEAQGGHVVVERPTDGIGALIAVRLPIDSPDASEAAVAKEASGTVG